MMATTNSVMERLAALGTTFFDILTVVWETSLRYSLLNYRDVEHYVSLFCLVAGTGWFMWNKELRQKLRSKVMFFSAGKASATFTSFNIWLLFLAFGAPGVIRLWLLAAAPADAIIRHHVFETAYFETEKSYHDCLKKGLSPCLVAKKEKLEVIDSHRHLASIGMDIHHVAVTNKKLLASLSSIEQASAPSSDNNKSP